MSLVVDASVALRWYVEAPGSAAASELLEGSEPLISPDLVVAEVANAAWKLQRAGEISREHATRIAAAIPSAFAHLISASQLVSGAMEIATELDHPIYDCLYLALAEAEKIEMVTADGRLLNRVQDTDWQKRVRSLVLKG